MNNELIDKYFPDLTPLQRQQFERMGELYPEWNEKINVISRRDIGNLYTAHILHSLSIAKFFTPVAGTQFIDLGTGGGFPGIPLAVLWPDCQFHLIDRIGKKVGVAKSVADALGLANVSTQHGDMSECKLKADFVVSRAVMSLDDLVKAARRNISTRQRNRIPNGLICLKGGDITAEMGKINRDAVVQFPLDTVFYEPFFETKEVVYLPL